MKQTTKGISLIVLVITIIVMIILAGAIIITLTNGNVIAKAKEARDSQDFTNIREVLDSEKNDVTLNQTLFSQTNADNVNTKIPDKYKEYIQITPEGKVILLKNFDDETTTELAIRILGIISSGPVIPSGFVASSATGENSVENGLVIYEGTEAVNDSNVATAMTTRNQFVWIPVEGTLERTAFLGENLSTTYTEDTTSAGYIAMKASVEEYNGFYVSRYEAGTNTISTGSNLAMNGTLKPLSQKNKYVWNKISFATSGNVDTNNGAALVSKKAYDENTTVASTLLYGAQYDAMLNYINSTSTSVTDSTTWGNYFNSTFTVNAGAKYSSISPYSVYTDVSTPTTKPENTSWLLTTGASEQNKSKNIYDVAGNVWELTYENYPSFVNRIIRSGVLNYENTPAACRGRLDSDGSNYGTGFRFSLYIK